MSAHSRQVLERWFVFLGGAIAWLLHLLAAYAVAEFGCVAGWGEFLGQPLVVWLILGLTAPLLAIACLALLVGYRYERRFANQEPRGLEAQDPGVALVRYGVVANALFILTILAETLPVFFFLRGC
jgi:hypothetical protein